MSRPKAEAIIEKLGLIPHPEEGGFFVETYRAGETVPARVLDDRYDGKRSYGTAIFYMLTPDTYSHLHKLESDEIFHFYLGDPCEMIHLHPDGSTERIVMGSDIMNDQRLQVLVPQNVWQGMRLMDGGEFALVGCTVSPGFEFQDYRHGDRRQLLEQYPEEAELIEKLTADS